MKTLFGATAAFVIATAPAFAGGMSEPMMEPEIVVEESTGSSTGEFVFPLMMLAILAGIASGD